MNDPSIKLILAPVDFSEITPRVLEHAVYLARLLGAELLLLHVVHVPTLSEAGAWIDPVISPTVERDIREQLLSTAKQKLAELAAECAGSGAPVASEVREGVPFAEILKAAQERKCDLIALGSQGRTGLSHFLIGSVAERVVRRAHCHVYCVKPQPGKEDN